MSISSFDELCHYYLILSRDFSSFVFLPCRSPTRVRPLTKLISPVLLEGHPSDTLFLGPDPFVVWSSCPSPVVHVSGTPSFPRTVRAGSLFSGHANLASTALSSLFPLPTSVPSTARSLSPSPVSSSLREVNRSTPLPIVSVPDRTPPLSPMNVKICRVVSRPHTPDDRFYC